MAFRITRRSVILKVSAVIFAAAAYGIAVLALLGLPETVGRELS